MAKTSRGKTQITTHGIDYVPPLLPRAFTDAQAIARRALDAEVIHGDLAVNLIARPYSRRELRRNDLAGFYGVTQPSKLSAVWIEATLEREGQIVFFDPTDVGPRITALDWHADAGCPLVIGRWSEVLVTEGKAVPHTFRWCDSTTLLRPGEDVDYSQDVWVIASRHLALIAMGAALSWFSAGFERIGR